MPIKGDSWFDDDGQLDFEEVQEDTSWLADMAGVSQRRQAKIFCPEIRSRMPRLALGRTSQKNNCRKCSKETMLKLSKLLVAARSMQT